MTEMSNGENGAGSDRALEDRIVAADVDRRAAIEESLAAGPAATESERAFLEKLRAEWVVDAGGEEAPSAGDSEVFLVPAAPGAEEAIGPRGLTSATRRWVPYAAAAAVLAMAWAGGVFDRTAVDPADPGVQQGPSDVYLGTEGQDVGAPEFEGTVDWSAEFGGPFMFRLIVLDANPSEGADPIVWEEEALEQTAWTCPQDILDRLPERFIVEVYEAGRPGSAPGWRRTFRRKR